MGNFRGLLDVVQIPLDIGHKRRGYKLRDAVDRLFQVGRIDQPISVAPVLHDAQLDPVLFSSMW
jgi:hypothetical protein